MKTKLLPQFLVSTLFLAISAQADYPQTESEDNFLDFSIEELISLEIPDVISVSRKKQRFQHISRNHGTPSCAGHFKIE